MTDVDALSRAVEATVERFGGIDVVIANAGIAPIGTVATIDPAAFERTIEINLLGVWRTVRAALPHVVERRGYILPIASLAAALHMPLMAHYAATKAGVEAFSDSLRGELRHTGTKVGVAYFSFIDTDMVRESLDESPAKMLRENTPGPVSGVASVEAAGRAIVRAIERRARKAYAPRWVPIPLALRGMLQPLLERRTGDAIERAVKLAEAEAAAARAPRWPKQPEALKPGDVRAQRDEVEPPHLGPTGRLLAQAVDERAGLLEEDPEEHRRSRARDRRAKRAELSGSPDQVHRSRIEDSRARLVQAVLEGRGRSARGPPARARARAARRARR